MEGDEPIIKEHSKRNCLEFCPDCGSDDISEITGWCYNHHNPIFDGDRPFCAKPDECGFISEIKNAFFCNQCDTMYDKYKMANWNWSTVGYGNCPVGEEIPEETPEEYQDRLLNFLLKYEEDYLDKCIQQGHFLEAIGTLSIQIYEQLRFLIIKSIKQMYSIPLDNANRRYNVTLKVIKRLKDFQLSEYSLIYDILFGEEFEKLEKFRELRNDFIHSFERRENHTEISIKSLIEEIKIIERRLREVVNRYRILNGLS